jgi:hypothetical protein
LFTRNGYVNTNKTPIQWNNGNRMASSLELFRWVRPEGGFEWVNDVVMAPDNQPGIDQIDRTETRFLAPKAMPKPKHWQYNPLAEYPTLYRDFASLDPSEEAYAAFATAYGALGVGFFTEGARILTEGREPFCRWRAAHASMRRVADVLTAIQSSDAKVLSEWFTLHEGSASFRREDDLTWLQTGVVAMAGQLRDYLWIWANEAESDAEALIRIAKGWAQQQINEAVERDGHQSTARVLFDVDRKEMSLHLVPRTLLGAMWLQCARALTLNPIFRSCQHCGRWFELSPEKRRKQSLYCSSRCKVAAYRKRKADIGSEGQKR